MSAGRSLNEGLTPWASRAARGGACATRESLYANVASAFSDFSELRGMAVEVLIVKVVRGLRDSKYIEGSHVGYVGIYSKLGR